MTSTNATKADSEVQGPKSEDLDMIANFMDTILSNMKQRIKDVQAKNSTKEGSNFSADFKNIMTETQKEIISDFEKPLFITTKDAPKPLVNTNNESTNSQNLKQNSQPKNTNTNQNRTKTQQNSAKKINKQENSSLNSKSKGTNINHPKTPIKKVIKPITNRLTNSKSFTSKSLSTIHTLKKFNQPLIYTEKKFNNIRPNTANILKVSNIRPISKPIERTSLNSKNSQSIRTRSISKGININHTRNKSATGSITNDRKKILPTRNESEEKKIHRSNAVLKPMSSNLKQRENENKRPSSMNSKQNKNWRPITPMHPNNKNARPLSINNKTGQNNKNKNINNRNKNKVFQKTESTNQAQVKFVVKNNNEINIKNNNNNNSMNQNIEKTPIKITNNNNNINNTNQNIEKPIKLFKINRDKPKENNEKPPVQTELNTLETNKKECNNICIDKEMKQIDVNNNPIVSEEIVNEEPTKIIVEPVKKLDDSDLNVVHEKLQNLIDTIKHQQDISYQFDEKYSPENAEKCIHSSKLEDKKGEHKIEKLQEIQNPAQDLDKNKPEQQQNQQQLQQQQPQQQQPQQQQQKQQKQQQQQQQKQQQQQQQQQQQKQQHQQQQQQQKQQHQQQQQQQQKQQQQQQQKQQQQQQQQKQLPQTPKTNSDKSTTQRVVQQNKNQSRNNKNVIKQNFHVNIQKPMIINQSKIMPKVTSSILSKPPASVLSTSSNVTNTMSISTKSQDRTISESFSKKFNMLTPMEIIQDYVTMVNKAKKDRKTYTVCGNYYSIRRAFAERGWLEKIRFNLCDDKESWRRLEALSNFELVEGLKDKEKQEKYRKVFVSKLLAGHQVDFYWDYMTNPFNVNNDKIKRTLINRFPFGATKAYTTKAGLSEALNEAYWYYIEGYSNIIFPRTYNLIHKEEIRTFVEDFYITAAISLLQWVCENAGNYKNIISPAGLVPTSVFNFATIQCNNYIKIKEHRDIDEIITIARDYEWEVFLDKFYKIIHQNQHFKECDKMNASLIIDQSRYLLNKIRKILPNVDYDGHMNLWLLKPNNGSRGSGIHVCRTLKYTLDVVQNRTDTKYVIQKYIERPLLIHRTKFDIRQWFLVSCMPNLQVWLYKDCYLRFSTQVFDLSKLHESIHLTNNSIQCRYKNSANRSNALPEQNMWHSDTFRRYLSDIGQPFVWRNIIYRGIKECLIGLFMLCQEKMITRVNSFELCGADFMLTEDYRPHLIEINSRPALYPSTKITAKMCPQVLEDVVKVTIDYARNSKASTGNFELIYHDKLDFIPPKNINSLYIQGVSYFTKFASPPQPYVDPTEKCCIKKIDENSGYSIKKLLNIDPAKVRKDVKNSLEKILAIIHSEQDKTYDREVQLSRNLQFKAMLSEFVDIISSIKTT